MGQKKHYVLDFSILMFVVLLVVLIAVFIF